MASQKAQLFTGSENELPPPPNYTAEAVQFAPYRDNPHPEARLQYPDHEQHLSSAREEDQRAFAIHAATFADLDITAKVQSMVTVDQTLSLYCMRANEYFGSVWYGTRKTICILYQYEGRGLELLVAREDEMIKIDYREPVDACRVRMLKSGGKVMAVVWGLRDGLEGEEGVVKKAVIEGSKSFECTNEWFGFDGYPNEVKSCTVFLRDGDGVRAVTARENETLSLV